jgi:hypothetical protein
MSAQQTTKWCRGCNRQVLAARRGTNHVLHLLLTIFTGGLWGIVWILSAVKIGGWRCQACGMKC